MVPQTPALPRSVLEPTQFLVSPCPDNSTSSPKAVFLYARTIPGNVAVTEARGGHVSGVDGSDFRAISGYSSVPPWRGWLLHWNPEVWEQWGREMTIDGTASNFGPGGTCVPPQNRTSLDSCQAASCAR